MNEHGYRFNGSRRSRGRFYIKFWKVTMVGSGSRVIKIRLKEIKGGCLKGVVSVSRKIFMLDLQ